ncbi:hypothetical protein BKA70DRAFT_563628 [Coprinopsis sp. MPI-PUGE-AT-0042]|nr:hypothetical protein BKA70DRAFT_563628 [Coprinopsis sp. MPI-PUGE-AT-0042]
MMAHPPQNGSRGASGPIYPSAGVSSSQVQITHPYPSRLDTRSKVVEILSAAANGCLAELGYDPYRVAQLEQTANEWQKENVQLYADNTQLLQQLRWLKEQLALSPNEALKQLVQARNDNAALLKERDALLRRLADLEKQQPTGPTYRQLHSEYMKVLHSKNLLEANIRQLRNQIQQDRTMPRQTQPITSGGAPLPHHPGTLVVQNPVQTSSTSSTRRPRPVSQPVAHPNAVPQEVRVAPPRPQGRNSAESMSSATPQHSPPLTTQFLSYQPIVGLVHLKAK